MKKKLASKEKITRKEAISKAGKYALFTASSMMTILNPVKVQAQSSPDLPSDWEWY